MIVADFKGWDELKTKFGNLETKLRKQILAKAGRAGGKILLNSAKSLVPVKSGKLKSSLKVKTKKSKDGYIRLMVGTSAKWFVGPEFYGAFQEFGWKQGSRKLGNKRKKIAGEHYVEYTYDNKGEQTAQEVIDVLLFEVFKTL